MRIYPMINNPKIYACLLFFILTFYISAAIAGGLSLSGSRIIYPASEKQTSFSVNNTDESATYLIQSWVETPDGNKTSDFIVTPPIYTSKPNSENVLRIIASRHDFPSDRETLYYFNIKAVPGINRNNQENQSSLVIATETRLKFFVRPARLKPTRENATKLLKFTLQNGHLNIDNPTPYFLTLTDITIGSQKVDDVMIAPLISENVTLTGHVGDTVNYKSLNDFGGVDETQSQIK